MHIMSKYNKGFRFLLLSIFLKDKKVIIITNAFQKINESGRKPNKIWIDKCSEFYNRSMKLWLQDNDIELHSTHNEVKSERFTRTLKNKIYKYMT